MYSFKSKKVMKFNKLTHLTIIVVLAIVFIVVYLYYTIKDVKKIHNEVSKLTTDITEMNKSISSITTALIPMLKTNQVELDVNQCTYTPVPSRGMMGQQVDINDDSSVGSQELKNIMETIDDEEQQQDAAIDISNDVANLDDIKDVEEMFVENQSSQQTLKDVSKTLDISKIEEIKSQMDVQKGEVNEEIDLSSLSLEEIKKVSYEQIRKYCKNNNINYKGSKDVLIYRIKGIGG